MYINKSTRYRLFSMAVLFMVAGIANLVEFSFDGLPIRLSAFAELCYFAICIVTMVYVERNILNKSARRLAMLAIIVVLIWQIIRTFEISGTPLNGELDRHFWYLYYFPMTLIPNLLFLAALNSRYHSTEKINPIWYLTLVVSFVLALAVQTNDYHHLAFTFPDGEKLFSISYKLGPLFFAIIAWIYVMIIAIGVVFYRSTSINRIKRFRWAIYTYIGITVVFMILRILSIYKVIDGGIFTVMFAEPEVWLAFTLIGVELGIRTGYVRSNFNYDELYMASTIPTAIMDNKDNEIYRSATEVETTKEQREAAIGGGVYIDENRRLHGQSIPGGYTYWIEDLSTINSSAKELSLIKEMLQQDNDLIKAENDMIERRIKTEEQMKLYDMLSHNVEPQLAKIENLIHAFPPEDPRFKDNLKKACVYKVFVKRLSNLILLNSQNDQLNSFELESCIRESVEYLKINDIKCTYTNSGMGVFPGERLIAAYTIFQRIVEDNVEKASRMMINLDTDEERIKLGILISCQGDSISAEKGKTLEEEKAKLESIGGSLFYNIGGEAMYVDMEIPKGGDGK